MNEQKILLNTGADLPIVGLGTWDLAGVAEKAVLDALALGYRHIDTAKIYDTEAEIGRAITKSEIPREDIFITTKLWRNEVGLKAAQKGIDASLDRLGMDYVDLYLIHWPCVDSVEGARIREETWQGMEAVFQEGKAKAIGVSNYDRSHLAEMEMYANIPPAVNQIEVHPFCIPNETIAYCHEHDIAVVDYSPLARKHNWDDATLVAIAKAHKRSIAQIMLRWAVQEGRAVIPKTANKKHMAEKT